MDENLKELIERLDQLEQMMKTLKGQGMSYYINIEHADIQGPIVDKLDYNFDKLDVKEVSGALNLGNNFGVRVGQIKKKEGRGKSPASGEKSKESPKQNEKGEEAKPKKATSDEVKTKDIEKKPASDSYQSNASVTAGGQKENAQSKSEGESRETLFLTKGKLGEEQSPDKLIIKMGPNNVLKLNIRGAPSQDKAD